MDALGHSWGALGALLGALGTLLDRSGMLLGRSWAALGRSWGALEGSWRPLGPLLDASWTQLEKVSRGLEILSLNMAAKIHPSWLQNPEKMHVETNVDFETRFFRFLCIFH